MANRRTCSAVKRRICVGTSVTHYSGREVMIASSERNHL
jgi:hypothetical protein